MTAGGDPAVVSPELLTAQRAAIDESGWARAFVWFQPHNAAFWLWLIGIAAGAVIMYRHYAVDFELYGAALIVSSIAFALYTIPFWWFIRSNDRYEREPAKIAVVGFVWGGLAATWWISSPANTALLGLYSKIFGQAWTQDWGNAFSAPFTEEPAKGVGLVLLIVLAPLLIRSAYDGLILGAFIGLGFQVVENVLYATNSAATGFGVDVAAVLQVVVARALTGAFSHATYSALFGMGLIWLLGRPTEPRRVRRGVAFIGFAILAHFLWNATGVFGGLLGAVLVYSLLIVDVVILVVGARWAATRERQWMRALMAPEAARGVITTAELDALSGLFKDRVEYINTFESKHDQAAVKRILRAATDLAEAIGSANGEETEKVRDARSAVARVRAEQPVNEYAPGDSNPEPAD